MCIIAQMFKHVNIFGIIVVASIAGATIPPIALAQTQTRERTAWNRLPSTSTKMRLPVSVTGVVAGSFPAKFSKLYLYSLFFCFALE
jgi:hypothetical protein